MLVNLLWLWPNFRATEVCRKIENECPSLWGTGGSLISGVLINNNFYLVWGYDRSVFWHVSTVQQLSRSVGAPLIMSLISVTHTHGGALHKLYHLMLQCCNFSKGSHPMGCIQVSSTTSHPTCPFAYIRLPLQLTQQPPQKILFVNSTRTRIIWAKFKHGRVRLYSIRL